MQSLRNMTLKKSCVHNTFCVTTFVLLSTHFVLLLLYYK
uniref:Uncharacterized protein n=1 Tax=Anguilla anguilla TaxID=7936 RepID=A0A0E9R6Q7_ANGAN